MDRFVASVGVACCAGLAIALSPGVAAADDTSDFYSRPVADLAQRADGDILRSAPQDKIPGADTNLILYRSTGSSGQPIAVSGYTITPDVPWSGPGPRPVVAYAPGTSGMADRCASSRGIGTSPDTLTVAPLLAQGYQVVVTDFDGLGTPGGHTYINRRAAGNALLDAARAAVSTTGDPTTPVLVFGYSEGGHAAGAAAELAATHAPALNLKGSYVGAPPADARLNIDNVDGTPLSGTLFYVIDGLINAYPDRAEAIRAMFNEDGLRALDASQEYCVSDSEALGGVESRNLTRDGRSLKEYMTEEPIASLLAENVVGFTAPKRPVFLAHGVNDDTVPVIQSRVLAQRWRDAGATDITVREYQFPVLPMAGLNHLPGGIQAYPDALPWMRERLNKN